MDSKLEVIDVESIKVIEASEYGKFPQQATDKYEPFNTEYLLGINGTELIYVRYIDRSKINSASRTGDLVVGLYDSNGDLIKKKEYTQGTSAFKWIDKQVSKYK
jgi:hypothetical protein